MSTDKKLDEEKQKALNNNATAVNNLKLKHAEERVAEAHQQADADIAADPDLSLRSPNDDLDEGETARLGEDETPLV
jgi:hypothetical protein